MEVKENQLYYLGKPYSVETKIDESAKKVSLELAGDVFICTSPTAGEVDISGALKSFYTKAAKKYIESRLKLYQGNVKTKYKKFSIENHPDKWGSCNSNRELTFNWRLLMFPVKAIDYVVAHELCHLDHMNHDRSFWRLVGKVYPDYKSAMEILGSKKSY